MKPKSKAFAPRRMRDNNKPTQCMRKACKRCSRITDVTRTIVVHEENELCPKAGKRK